MFHPGGFGSEGEEFKRFFNRPEPSLYKAGFILLGLLFVWTLCFAVGIFLGFGWYALPLGSALLILCTLGLSIYLRSRH